MPDKTRGCRAEKLVPGWLCVLVRGKYFWVFGLLFLWTSAAFGQGAVTPSIQEVIVKIDTSAYYFSKDALLYNGEQHLAFPYTLEDLVTEVNLFPAKNLHSLKLLR